MVIELLEVRKMSAIERSEAAMRVAMSSPAKMIEWLEASGRAWLVFNSRHLIESLAWPEGAKLLQLVVAGYRDHRAALKYQKSNEGLDIGYSETLEIEELDRAIRYLMGEISKLDPDWKLESDPQ